jgi:hypothetical protein
LYQEDAVALVELTRVVTSDIPLFESLGLREFGGVFGAVGRGVSSGTISGTVPPLAATHGTDTLIVVALILALGVTAQVLADRFKVPSVCSIENGRQRQDYSVTV